MAHSRATGLDSDEVKQWLKELDGHDIPDFSPTKDGSCAGDPAAAAQAQQRGWWTCGKYTSGNDIVDCPDKYTWGVSFDDGPAPHSEYRGFIVLSIGMLTGLS